MKKLLLAGVCCLLAAAFQACNKSTPVDAGDILSTVPSDVSMVAVINSQQVLEKAGCKIDGDKITPGKEVLAAVAKIKNPQMKEFVSALVNGEAGVNPTVLVLFREGYNTYLTGVVTNPEKLKEAVAKNANMTFTNTNGIESARNLAINANRFWLNLNGSSIDLNDVRHFSTLTASQSFMQNVYAPNLAEITTDVSGWGNIKALLNTSSMGFQQSATMQMAINMLFDKPEAFAFTVNSSKGEAEAKINVLNDKGNNAKFLLPSEKVDLTAISSIGGTADRLFAISVPAKLISKLKKETESKTASVFGIYLNAMGCIDGTIAVAADGENMKGIISTDGKDVAPLSQMLTSMGFETKINGTTLDVFKGSLTGKCSVAEMAQSFKNAIGGAMFYGAEALPNGQTSPFQSVSFMLYGEGSGLRMEVKAVASDPKQNPIISFLNE